MNAERADRPGGLRREPEVLQIKEDLRGHLPSNALTNVWLRRREARESQRKVMYFVLARLSSLFCGVTFAALDFLDAYFRRLLHYRRKSEGD